VEKGRSKSENGKKKHIEFDSCRKYQKKDENIHIYANFIPEKELI